MSTAKLAHRYALDVDVDTVILGVKNRVELRECLDAESEGALSAQLTRQIDEAVGRRCSDGANGVMLWSSSPKHR